MLATDEKDRYRINQPVKCPLATGSGKKKDIPNVFCSDTEPADDRTGTFLVQHSVHIKK